MIIHFGAVATFAAKPSLFAGGLLSFIGIKSYRILWVLLLPVLVLRLLYKAIRQPSYRQGIAQRLALDVLPKAVRPAIMLHAVSVGEAMAARPLIEKILIHYPQHDVWVTSTTPTGYDTVSRLLAGRVKQRYLPYDVPWAAPRLLKALRVECLIVMETELWPNLLFACKELTTPVIMANARLSGRSVKGYQRIQGLVADSLACVSMIACRDEQDKQRFLSLGASHERVKVTGNIKYDMLLPNGLSEQADAIRLLWCLPNQQKVSRLSIVLAASTHEGEDEQVLAAFVALKKTMPKLKLMIVPRHPERFERVYQLACDTGYAVIRRSELNVDGSDEIESDLLKPINNVAHQTAYNNQPSLLSHADILIGDSMGELLLWYALADVVFMGGSLVATGGHNPLEPAALAKPVITGSEVFNFSEVYAALEEQEAVITVSDQTSLQNAIMQLLQEPQQSQAMGEKAYRLLQQHSGTTERIMQLVEQVYPDTQCDNIA